MTPVAKAQWQMHFCVLLWGFTAILGKAITLDAMALVVWRMGLVTAALLLVPRVWRGMAALPPRLLLTYAGIGTLVALHWLTFYGAIKLANASVAVTCIALATVFVPMVEPWITGRKFEPRELLIGVAVVPGVALVVGGVPDGMRLGIVMVRVHANAVIADLGIPGARCRQVVHADSHFGGPGMLQHIAQCLLDNCHQVGSTVPMQLHGSIKDLHVPGHLDVAALQHGLHAVAQPC